MAVSFILLTARLSAKGCGVLAATTLALGALGATETGERFTATNAQQVIRLVEASKRTISPIRLEATALFTSSTETIVLIRDETGAAYLPVDLRGHRVVRGERLRLSGMCLFSDGQAIVGEDRLIDNDGLHDSGETSGEVFLGAGKHPIRVCVFNQDGEFTLEAYYQGPGLPRQRIPSEVLFHQEIDTITHITNWVRGLTYRCFEGAWDRLPVVERLAASKTGSALNFDLSVAPRTNQVAIEFGGYIDIQQEGVYTFWLRSDDGSGLWLDKPPALLEVTGTNSLPPVRKVIPGQMFARTEGPELARAEGIVSFVNELSSDPDLIFELSDGGAKMRVRVLDPGKLSPNLLPGCRLRVSGLFQSSHGTDGRQYAGNLIVPTAAEVELLETPTSLGPVANAESLPLLTTAAQIKNLRPKEADRGYPVKIRGVLTLVWKESGFVLQDETWSVFVAWLPGMDPDLPRAGDYWEVEGVSVPGFAPNVTPKRAVRLGNGALPEPLHPTWDRLVNGSLDTQYVEVQGMVTGTDDRTVSLLTPGGGVRVELPEFAAEAVNKLENALIRARGCLVPIKDESTLGVKLGVFALYNAAISIEEPAPADPFVLPLRQVQDLQLFRYGSAALQRIKLSGQLLSEHSGTLYLADGTNGFRCVPKAKFSAETGDWVEVVGFPELDRPSPLLREAVLRKVGSRPLPDACIVTPGTTLDGRLDSRRVQLTCRLQGQRADSTDQLLELQDDARMFLARLPKRIGPPPRLVNGSLVRLTGVYVGLGGDRTTGREIDSFELLLNDRSAIEVLEKPSWWSAGHAVAVAGALAAVLILAGAWIAALRRRVEQRTGELRKQVELHQQAEKRLAEQAGLLAGEVRERKQAEDILREQKGLLEREIEERKRAQQQADAATQQLLTTSRQAGMAEIATNVLHNVGNVLNSVNVSATLLADKIATSGISRVSRLADLLREHQNDLADFLTRHPKGGQLPDYVGLLANKLAEEQSFALRELRSLRENVEHIKRIVSMQQAYAKARGVSESVAPSDLMEDALRLNDSRLSKRDIVVRREYQPGLERICLDKHKALQILVNLISNAQRACADSAQPEKQIFLRVYGEEGKICFVVGDNGVGIPPENLTRIFHNGFTTRKDGHGFGLHSSALAAKELGGTLSARSDGPGKGAWFQLELPAASTPPQSSSASV